MVLAPTTMRPMARRGNPPGQSLLFLDRFVQVPQVGAASPLGMALVLVHSHRPHLPGGTPTFVGDRPDRPLGQSSPQVDPWAITLLA
jgi:hypothetical protein